LCPQRAIDSVIGPKRFQHLTTARFVEDGYCAVDGPKVPVRRTSLRSQGNREQRLGSYELFDRSTTLERAVWEKIKPNG